MPGYCEFRYIWQLAFGVSVENAEITVELAPACLDFLLISQDFWGIRLTDNGGIARCPASTPDGPAAPCPFEIKTDWQCGTHSGLEFGNGIRKHFGPLLTYYVVGRTGTHCFSTGGLELHYCPARTPQGAVVAATAIT